MKETRKPYTVASYEAGKKAETRDERNVNHLKWDGEAFTGLIEGDSASKAWFSGGNWRFLKSSEFDLFEKD